MSVQRKIFENLAMILSFVWQWMIHLYVKHGLKNIKLKDKWENNTDHMIEKKTMFSMNFRFEF